MRHLIFALMIALLPLRGWVGDAMATDMASTHARQVAIKTIAESPQGIRAASHFEHNASMQDAAQAAPDCAGHPDQEDTSSAANSHCESCSACQACHTVALSPAAARLPLVFHASPPPPAAPYLFASADAALGQKPPIS